MSDASGRTLGDMMRTKVETEVKILNLLQDFCDQFEVGVTDIEITRRTMVQVTDYDYEEPRMISRPDRMSISVSVGT